MGKLPEYRRRSEVVETLKAPEPVVVPAAPLIHEPIQMSFNVSGMNGSVFERAVRALEVIAEGIGKIEPKIEVNVPDLPPPVVNVPALDLGAIENGLVKLAELFAKQEPADLSGLEKVAEKLLEAIKKQPAPIVNVPAPQITRGAKD